MAAAFVSLPVPTGPHQTCPPVHAFELKLEASLPCLNPAVLLSMLHCRSAVDGGRQQAAEARGGGG